MSNPPSTPITVLFVDDDADVIKAASLLLTRRGFRLLAASGPAEARSLLATETVDVILLDLNFTPRATSGEEGLRFLDDVLRQDPRAVVVVVTGHSGINVAVAAMRAGAADFVMKPWSNDRLVATLNDAAARRRTHARDTSSETPDDEIAILGDSPAIEAVRDLIRRAAPTPASVLIQGEPGTGKSLTARAIHRQSASGDGPLVVLDLSAADDVAEAVARAAGGTLVLDAIEAAEPLLQTRLLALLEDGPQSRTITLSRRSSVQLEAPGGLRPDLLFRLNTVEITLPALRDRNGDALLLARHWLRLYARRYGKAERALSSEAAEAVSGDRWPGNVRALRQTLERAVILTDGVSISAADLRLGGGGGQAPTAPDLNIARSEKALVEAALKRNSFNVSRAAQELGLTRAALYRRMAKHGL